MGGPGKASSGDPLAQMLNTIAQRNAGAGAKPAASGVAPTAPLDPTNQEAMRGATLIASGANSLPLLPSPTRSSAQLLGG